MWFKVIPNIEFLPAGVLHMAGPVLQPMALQYITIIAILPSLGLATDQLEGVSSVITVHNDLNKPALERKLAI